MKLSKYEKETIILTNEEDRYYSVYTLIECVKLFL